MAKAGLANGAFEESAEDGGAVVDEFFPEDVPQLPVANPSARSLSQKLTEKSARLASAKGD